MSLDHEVERSARPRPSLLRCAGISDTSTLAAGRPDASTPSARIARTRAAVELVARALDNALLPWFLSDVFFQIAELRMNFSSGLTKWGSPRIMHSLVMLIATRNQGLAPCAAACTGRVWSGSSRPGGQYRHDRRSGWSGWSMAAVVASQMCQVRETLRTHEEDTTRKQSIPHPRGAPDS